MSLLQSAISITPAGDEAGRKDGKRSPILTRVCAFLLLLVICINLVPPAHAYSIVHIQASIDLATWEILTGVVRDEVGITSSSPEWKRMSKEDLDALSAGDFNNLDLIDADKVGTRDKDLGHGGNVIGGIAQNFGIGVEENRVLSFPTNQTKRDSSNSTDMEAAMAANNAIVFDLNQAFRIYCDKNKIARTPDATAMLTAIKNFMSEAGQNRSGDFINYYSSANAASKDTKYRWKTPKYQDGTEVITWSMLIVEAFNNFSLEGDEAVDADNVFASNPNQLTKSIVGFFSNALDSLRSILGLWTMDELMFNEGWRETGYVGGIFPTNWEPIIWALFIFTEIIAAMILLVGIVMNVLKQAASTMNTIARIHAMSQVQDLLVCGVALTLLPLALRMVIAMSGNLVGIISAIRPISVTTGEPKTIQEMVARFSSSNGTFGGFLAQCLFFGAQVYFNFFYALRALTTAILIIMAPMMVAMITVSSSKKQITMTWAKELLANILVQPIHVFCITVILLLPTSTHGFDNLIAIYAMIPFTSMIRGLFFGPAGGFLDQVSGKGAAITNGAIAGGVMGAASRAGSGILNFAKDKIGGGGGKGGSSEGGSNEGGEGAGGAGGTNTNLSNPNAERSSNAANNGQPGNEAAGAAAGAAAGGATGGAGGGSEETGGAGAASPIADAQNGTASSNSPQGGQAGAGNGQKPSFADRWNKFQDSNFGRIARIGGGIALGGLGGALSGAGLHGVGSSVSSAADSLVASRGQQKKEADKREEDKEKDRQEQDANGNDTGADPDLSRNQNQPVDEKKDNESNRDINQPVDLGSVGKRKANDSSGNQPMQVRDLDQKELDKQGISDVDDSRKTMEFTANGNSEQAKELGAYADYLQSLPPDQRKKVVSDKGIEATRDGDGVQVRIDKNKWSKANDGAQISARTDPKTGDTTMRIKSPEGGKVPSFTGGVPKSSVHPVSVPNATVTGTTTLKNGQELSRPQDIEQKALDHGMSNKAAAKAADRVGAIRQLQEQGYSPAEAAKLSKKMVSGVQDRRAELSIPKASLTPDQSATMIQAVQAGEASSTGDSFQTEYDPTKGSAPIMEPKDSDVSFSGVMEQQSVEAAPAPVEVSDPPNQGPAPADAPVEATIDAPVEAPSDSPMPAAPASETNGVSSVPTQAASPINAQLAERYAAYQAAKQETGSASQAYAATHRNIGAPQPSAPAQPSSNAGAGMANVNMGRANTNPAPNPVPNPNPSPAPAPAAPIQNRPAPAPVSPVNQGRPAPTPVSAPAPRSWAPGTRPSANPHRAAMNQPNPAPAPVQPAAQPEPASASPVSEISFAAPQEQPAPPDILSQEELDAMGAEILREAAADFPEDAFIDPFAD